MSTNTKILIICITLSACLILAGIVVFIFVNIHDDPPFVEANINEPGCNVACWKGLEPGSTTEQQVREFLVANSYSIREPNDIDYGSYTMLIASNNSEDIFFLFNNSVLELIEVSANFELTLNQIIDLLGSPDYVAAVRIQNSGGQFEAYTKLYYPELGYSFFTRDIETSNNDDIICFSRESHISRIRITSVLSIEGLIALEGIPFSQACEERDISCQELIETLMARLIPWPGFTCFDAPTY